MRAFPLSVLYWAAHAATIHVVVVMLKFDMDDEIGCGEVVPPARHTKDVSLEKSRGVFLSLEMQKCSKLLLIHIFFVVMRCFQ